MTMMLPLQMRVKSCCKGVAHGDAGVGCWRDMRAAGFGEKGEEDDTHEGVPSLEAHWRVMQGLDSIPPGTERHQRCGVIMV